MPIQAYLTCRCGAMNLLGLFAKKEANNDAGWALLHPGRGAQLRNPPVAPQVQRVQPSGVLGMPTRPGM